MTKMASRPIYGKHLKNSFETKSLITLYLETCDMASGTHLLPNLYKGWHWVDLYHFYDMVKFVFLMPLHGSEYSHVFSSLF